jgi:hypothetical protein
MKTKEMLEYRHPEGLTRIRKKPVFLCHARCFYSAREAEDFAREMGRRITGTRKHYMKGTDITLYLLDFTTKIKTEDE